MFARVWNKNALWQHYLNKRFHGEFNEELSQHQGSNMKKMIGLMLTLSLLSVSCNKSGGSSSDGSTSTSTNAADANNASADSSTGSSTGPSSTGGPTPSPVPAATSTLPALALSFQTNVNMMSFTAAQITKYQAAVAIAKKVIGTEAFRTRILNYTWSGAKQFANNIGRTNAQIYQTILDAAETLQPSKNNTMDLGVKMYYENSSIIGFTNGSITYINVNTKFFDQFNAAEVAGNLMHEWLHKLGYDHDFSSTPQRPYSVPYAIGYLVRDIGASFL
jgi:hypothetical protein